MVEEATFVILFLNVAFLFFYLCIEWLINYIITIILRFLSKRDDEHLEKEHQKSIKNIEQLIIFRVVTALLITIIIAAVIGVRGRNIFSYKDVVSIYDQFRSLQVIITAIIIIISTFILAIINKYTCNNIFKFLFFVATSIVLQVNFLMYNTYAVFNF